MSDRIAFIDMPFHKKTKSSAFFIDLLGTKYGKDHIDIFYDNTSEGGNVELGYVENKKIYSTIVFWQMLPKPHILQQLYDKNIIYIPMYDDFHGYVFFLYYLKLYNVKVICFCKKIYEFFQKLDVPSLYIQYYMPYTSHPVYYNGLRIFWRYRGDISWENIKTILGTQKIDYITIKNVPDPLHQKISFDDEDIATYNITIIDNFSTHEEHLSTLQQHTIFIAPRYKEGIGMSILEALRLGMCVISYDGPTMSEYIQHGVDGILTDFRQPIDLSFYSSLGSAALQRYAAGLNRWEQSLPSILSFIEKPIQKRKPPIAFVRGHGIIHYIASYIARCIWICKYHLRSLRTFYHR